MDPITDVTIFQRPKDLEATPIVDNQPDSDPVQGDVTTDGCMVLQLGDFVPWDNPDNLMSEQVKNDLSLVFHLALTPLFSLVGIVGNILCAIVFCRQGLRDRITMCLFCLAMADLLTLVPLLLLAFEAAYKTLVGELNFFVTYFVGLTGFTWVSMFLSAVIASERCLCVVSPLKARQVLSTCTMFVIIVIVSAVLLGGMLAIAGPKHTSACVFDPATNQTSTIVHVTTYYLENQWILDIIDIFVYATAIPAFFIIVIIITTVITAIKLHTAATWRQRTTSIYCISNHNNNNPATTNRRPSQGKPTLRLSKMEVAVTKMLIVTSVIFVICNLPSLIVQITIFFVRDLSYGGRYHNTISVLWTLVSFFRVVNSSVNFFVYLKMGSKFRETLNEISSCCRKVS